METVPSNLFLMLNYSIKDWSVIMNMNEIDSCIAAIARPAAFHAAHLSWNNAAINSEFITELLRMMRSFDGDSSSLKHRYIGQSYAHHESWSRSFKDLKIFLSCQSISNYIFFLTLLTLEDSHSIFFKYVQHKQFHFYKCNVVT